MNNNYSPFCDDFFVEMLINTQMELPSERDTLFTFFERIQKQFPQMANFYRRENGDFCLESDRDCSNYTWVAIELDRLTAGASNPENIDNVKFLQKTVLDLAPHMLGLSYLDINSLDVSVEMDFDFTGNHNEIITEALYRDSAFSTLLDNPSSKPLRVSPGFIIAFDDNCRLQAKLSVEAGTNVFEIRTGKYKESDPISLHYTIRQYPEPNQKFDAFSSYDNQFCILEEQMNSKIIPNFIKPLTQSIAHRR